MASTASASAAHTSPPSNGAPATNAVPTSPTPARKNVFKTLTRSFSARASKTAVVPTVPDELKGSSLKKSNSLKEEYSPSQASQQQAQASTPAHTSPSITRKSSLSRLQFSNRGLSSSNSASKHNRSRSASPSGQSPLRISPGHSPSAVRRPPLRAGTCGQMEVSFFYISNEEVLHITLHRLRDFPGVEPSMPIDMTAKVNIIIQQAKLGKRKCKAKELEPESQQPCFSEALAPYRIPAASFGDAVMYLQVKTGDRVAEAYIPLGSVDSTTNTVTTAWHWLQPKQTEAKRKGSSKSWRKKSEQESEDTKPLIAWLNEQSMLSFQLGIPAEFREALRLASFKNKKWSDIVPPIGLLTGKDQMRAEAIWELFSSECSHLAVLCLLMDPFQKYLNIICAQEDNDARVVQHLREIKVGKLFGNLDELMRISCKFASDLEKALILGAEGKSDPKAILAAVSSVHPVIQAFIDLQEDLLEPELRYRLHYKKARAYLKRLVHDIGPQFAAYLDWCEEDSRCGRLAFNDLIVQPLQRLTRYPLLLKAILKRMDPDSGDCEEQRTWLEKTVVDLEKAINSHNSVVQDSECKDKLRKIELYLVWPSAIDRNQKTFIPEIHRKFLESRPRVSLQTALHRLEPRGETISRQFIYEGWLAIMSRAARGTENVFVYIVGDLVIMTKPYQRTSYQPERDSDDETGNVDNMTKEVVDRPYHFSELIVLDVPDDEQLKDCFMLIVLDCFDNPNQCFTLRAESLYAKTDWLRYLRNGIKKCHEEREELEKSIRVEILDKMKLSSAGSAASFRRGSLPNSHRSSVVEFPTKIRSPIALDAAAQASRPNVRVHGSMGDEELFPGMAVPESSDTEASRQPSPHPLLQGALGEESSSSSEDEGQEDTNLKYLSSKLEALTARDSMSSIASDGSYSNELKNAVRIGAAVAGARRSRPHQQLLDSRSSSMHSMPDTSSEAAGQGSSLIYTATPLHQQHSALQSQLVVPLEYGAAPIRLNPTLLARIQREHGSFSGRSEDSMRSSKTSFCDSESEIPLEAYDRSPGRSPISALNSQNLESLESREQDPAAVPPLDRAHSEMSGGSSLFSPEELAPHIVSPADDDLRSRSVSFSAIPRSVSHESDLPRSRSGSAVHARLSSGSLFELAMQRRRTSSMKSLQQQSQRSSAHHLSHEQHEGDEQDPELALEEVPHTTSGEDCEASVFGAEEHEGILPTDESAREEAAALLMRMPSGSLHDLLMSGKMKRSFSMDTAAHLSEETEHQLHDAKEGIVDFGGPGTSIV